MYFLKGMMIGMMAGIAVGVINSDKIYDMARYSSKKMNKFMRSCCN